MAAPDCPRVRGGRLMSQSSVRRPGGDDPPESGAVEKGDDDHPVPSLACRSRSGGFGSGRDARCRRRGSGGGGFAAIATSPSTRPGRRRCAWLPTSRRATPHRTVMAGRVGGRAPRRWRTSTTRFAEIGRAATGPPDRAPAPTRCGAASPVPGGGGGGRPPAGVRRRDARPRPPAPHPGAARQRP